ncbi:TetR/AcrR family transcriptional regulator [Saccharopolyspora sp. HNM0983]|uniref:TetR/AcrR family transcriptional regulator n=1 Tax=Saccharopolyspora montiporae TaxID=2781240 RepID=A0A929B7N5_9PSEU|nr:TetR/AcrR family transcriptional regulator [Saccharopolyspora sp. HNM0983]MBE9373710.1 TetR/AcrR family transcriptional regulator [Saccharopolyspora sp. HNM0983]
MNAASRGRPRHTDRSRTDLTAPEEILQAAAELFTQHGYAATSTRRIAESVGMRQASLYYYFPTKDAILAELLNDTVQRPLECHEALRALDLAPEVHLHALCSADCTQLWTSPWNVGVLCLLPEVRTERFAEFRSGRTALRLTYRELSARVLAALPAPRAEDYVPDPAADVVFRLTETLPNLRSDGLGADRQPGRISDLALHVLGWRGDWDRLRAGSARALRAAGA